MADNNDRLADDATADDRIAELLAAYDEALANGREPATLVRGDEFAPDTAAEIHSLQLKLRTLHRVRKTSSASSISPRPRETPATGSEVEPTPFEGMERSDDGTLPGTLPKRLGRFEIVRELGSGGSGVVLLRATRR